MKTIEMPQRSLRPRRALRALTLVALATSPWASTAWGVTTTWLNTGTSYNLAANWNNGVPNTSSDIAVFMGTPASQPNLTTGVQINVLELHTPGWTFSGSRLGLGGTSPTISTPGLPSGIVTFNNGLGLNATGIWANSLAVNVNGLLDTGGGTSNSRSLTLNGAPLTVNGGFALVGSGVTMTSTRLVTLAGTANVTIDSTISDGLTAGVSGSLFSDLSGLLTLTGTNTYTGTTRLGGQGIVAFNGDRAFGAVPAAALADSIQITGSGTFEILRLIDGSGDVALDANRGIVVGTASANRNLTFDVPGATDTLQINGPISEGGLTRGRLVKTGAGTLALNADNTYSGSTNFNSNSVIAVNHNNALGLGSLVTSGGATVLSSNGPRTIANDVFINGSTVIAGSENFTFTGPWSHRGTSDRTVTVSNSAATTIANSVTLTSVVAENRSWTFQGTGGELIFSSSIANGPAVGNVNFNRNGVTTLNGNNTYTGATNISNGTVRLNGSHSPAGPYTVNSGTFAGTGAIANSLTVKDNASLSPGNSIGTLSASSLDLQAGSIFLIEINFNEFVASSADKFIATGPSAAVTLGNGSAFPTIQFSFTYTGEPINSQSFVLIQNDAPTNTTTGQFEGIAQLATIVDGYRTYSIDYSGGDGNDVVITFTSIPEPMATPLALLGALGLRRRVKCS